ncbi:DEAD/DEAH box helicase [Chitinophaga sancti]|uniref:DEAD/DEAH box helicase n=1 Tax=Chitinophaga sancti TaxID=1004 RepID=A0A1K1RJC0_9BACT|nr:DEAD/DEAH box helicase [Chitinophaga sancti]WQD60662.1 DEAD/DEAH box helicase [Chitinophaga sancti]WQG87210.1 DEAD/DEAH box helicase [Chitinophaga sancti]SFW71790.1 Superfamily II DNA and RNA helicase [Chitinophaga sancti]
MQNEYENILSALQIDALNEMQTASIKANQETDNVILLSDTGSGKTLGFLIPVLESLNKTAAGTQALIVVPSRELALQIETVWKNMRTGAKITCCYGGHKRETEENNLQEAPALIVGTPGRLGDHIRRENIKPDTIKMLVLDEFDKSLELGFVDELEFILNSLPNLKKRLLTSATDTVEIPEFVKLDNPVTLDFLSGEPAPALAIKYVESPEKDKLDTLFQLVCKLGNRSTIIFCNHREAVERTNSLLKDKGLVSVFYHGAMEQNEREAALAKFRNGSSNVLVTTDLAARGLDIPNIRYIIHYHLPNTEAIFTHRNGRTARMDASGTAILIIGPEEHLPDYISEDVELIDVEGEYEIPEKPKWTTFFIGAGKKDKVNKIDIVGFLSNRGELKKEDIGLIEVKDFYSFVAVRKSKASHVLNLIENQKIKNKKVKIAIAK